MTPNTSVEYDEGARVRVIGAPGYADFNGHVVIPTVTIGDLGKRTVVKADDNGYTAVFDNLNVYPREY